MEQFFSMEYVIGQQEYLEPLGPHIQVKNSVRFSARLGALTNRTPGSLLPCLRSLWLRLPRQSSLERGTTRLNF